MRSTGKSSFHCRETFSWCKITNITLEGMPHNIILFFNIFKRVEVKPMLKKSYKFIKAFWSKIAIKLTQNLHKSEKSDILILKCTVGVEVANLGLSPNLFFDFLIFVLFSKLFVCNKLSVVFGSGKSIRCPKKTPL